MYARMLSSNAHLKICLLYVTHFKPRVATSRYMYIIYTCTRYLRYLPTSCGNLERQSYPEFQLMLTYCSMIHRQELHVPDRDHRSLF